MTTQKEVKNMMPTSLDNNRYRILEQLGKGGFGETFLAEDTQMPSHRRCVIKQLKPVMNNPQVYQLVKDRFQREAAILEDLGDNDQIPRLYAYFTDAEQFYLVQELIEGETLSQRLQREGKLSESTVKDILLNILPVLDFVHSKRIVHRDIKPDNIILRNRDGKPVLIDFGAVRETMGTVVTTGGNATSSIVIGTPGFMPAEQSAGRPVYSSDLYSLGLTAIYLLTGKMPQELQTDYSTGELLWHQYANVSPTFMMILDKAIQNHPRDRYHTGSQMLEALRSNSTVIPPVNPGYSTEVSAPPPGGYPQQPTQVSHQQQGGYSQQPTQVSPQQYGGYQQPVTNQNQTSGMGDLQKAILTGGIIGVVVLGGLAVLQAQKNSPQPSPTPTVANSPSSPNNTLNNNSTQSPSPSNYNNNSTPSPITPPVQSPSTNTPSPSVQSISQEEAKNLVWTWITSKPRLFAPPYDQNLGDSLTTGKANMDNIRGPNSKGEAESSLEYLRNRGQYYRFGSPQLNEVERFEANGDEATIQIVVTEQLALYNSSGNVLTKYAGPLRGIYNLQKVNGQWKIRDYTAKRAY